MAELVTLAAFCGILAVCFAMNVSLTLSLFFGLLLFSGYVLYKKFSLRRLWEMIRDGVRTVHSVIPVFLLIGMLTALWRSCGTIAAVISYLSGFIRPGAVVMATFVLCCLISVLTGTSLGTAATMGVICMTMGRAMGAQPVLLGGAILSGAYFGDRCSPVSSSALLVCELTGTNIYDNLRRMARTAAVPFLLVCALYALLGAHMQPGSAVPDMSALFARELAIRPAALIPALLILLFAVFRLNVKLAMSASILSGILVCVFLQRQSVPEILRAMLLGYSAADAQVAAMLDGGGLVSMLEAIAVLLIAGAFGGIFRQTQLLSGIRRPLRAVAERGTPFAAVFCAALASALIACDQVLTILMTHQLCEDIQPDAGRLALSIEDTAVLLSPLMPWAIGSRVPLAAVGAPRASCACAFFLFVLPLCSLVGSLLRKRAAAKG